MLGCILLSVVTMFSHTHCWLWQTHILIHQLLQSEIFRTYPNYLHNDVILYH